MIYINLLPVRRIKKKLQARKQVLGMVVTLAAALVVLGLIAMVLGVKVSGLKANIADLKKERAKYQKTIDQIQQLQKDQALLETKLNTISQLKKGSQLTVRVMDELAKLTPSDRVWVTQMSFSGSALKIAATALDNATIADYMETLVTSPYFAKTELSGTTTKGVSGRQLKVFSLTISVTNADYAEEAPAEEGEAQG